MRKKKEVIKTTRLQNIVSLHTTKRLFEERLQTETRRKMRNSIKNMITLIESTIVDVRNAH